jgi:methionine biosynthesis protein MetW
LTDDVRDDQTSISPDAHGAGLVDAPLDALRYDNQTDDIHEAPGMLHALMPSGVRVLDVGCGTGSVTLIANRMKNNDVLGLEPDVQRAARSRSRGIDTVCGELDDTFSVRHGLFDVVVFADVLEHLPSPAEALTRAIPVLKPGGIVLISVPNVAHWTVRLRLLMGRFDYTDTGILDATHLRWFTAKTIRSLCTDVGLDVRSMQQAAGTWLAEYRQMFPWRIIPGRLRRPLIRLLARQFPLLFGCQHVLLAQVRPPR